MPLVLEENTVIRTSWWINAAYGVYTDMKSQSMGVMLLGKGSMQSKSSKHNLNIRISTESEIIGVDDHMSGILCSMRLLEVQGYKTE